MKVNKCIFIAILAVITISAANASIANDKISDPTKPFFTDSYENKVEVDSQLELMGIIKNNNSYKAFINGQLLSIGQSISGHYIAHISSNSVKLIKNGKETVIKASKRVRFNGRK